MEKQSANTDTQQVVLNETYYLENFTTLIEYVSDRYDDLLSNEEQAFITIFSGLPDGARQLYVRLISRKGPYFRKDKLVYNEIDSIEDAISILAENSMMLVNPRELPEFALDVFTKPELIELIKNDDRFIYESYFSTSQKQDLILELLEYNEKWIWELLESVSDLLVPVHREIVQTLMMLFFGNTHQTLSDFILEDIGVLKYEPYQINPDDRFYANREIIDGQLFLNAFRSELYMAIEVLDYDRIDALGGILMTYDLNPKLSRSRDKIFNTFGSFYERTGSLEMARDYYERSNVSPGRERYIRVLDKLGELDVALNKVEEMIQNPSDFSEIEFAPMFREKLCKKLELPVEKRKRRQFDSEELILSQQKELRIEEQVTNYFRAQDIRCYNFENDLFKSLYGLYFWEEIYGSLPEVFFNPYQRGPADLFTSRFYKNRQTAINAKLDLLTKEKTFVSRMLETFSLKYNTANYLVNWKAFDKETLETILKTIPGNDLKLIFTRMSINLREMSSGFPDLLILDNEGYKLLEVKGPGDQLRPNQRHWLGFFKDNEIRSGVLKIKWE